MPSGPSTFGEVRELPELRHLAHQTARASSPAPLHVLRASAQRRQQALRPERLGLAGVRERAHLHARRIRSVDHVREDPEPGVEERPRGVHDAFDPRLLGDLHAVPRLDDGEDVLLHAPASITPSAGAALASRAQGRATSLLRVLLDPPLALGVLDEESASRSSSPMRSRRISAARSASIAVVAAPGKLDDGLLHVQTVERRRSCARGPSRNVASPKRARGPRPRPAACRRGGEGAPGTRGRSPTSPRRKPCFARRLSRPGEPPVEQAGEPGERARVAPDRRRRRPRRSPRRGAGDRARRSGDRASARWPRGSSCGRDRSRCDRARR